MVYLRKKLQKGVAYYQLVLDNGSIIQIGNADKILNLVVFYRNHRDLWPKKVRVRGEKESVNTTGDAQNQG